MTARTSLVFLAALVTAGGCGTTVYRPSAWAQFDANAAHEVDDADIRRAFEASPQMPRRPRIAYYALDAERAAELEHGLRAMPQAADVYHIPPLLVTGERRFRAEDTRSVGAPARPLSLKKLRLLAARARCDLLVVFDYGYQIDTSANAWAAFGALVVPLVFVPFLDADVESYLEAFVIDTRNGFLYAHITSQEKSRAETLTLYSRAARRLVRYQWSDLLAQTRRALAGLLTARGPKALQSPAAGQSSS